MGIYFPSSPVVPCLLIAVPFGAIAILLGLKAKCKSSRDTWLLSSPLAGERLSQRGQC